MQACIALGSNLGDRIGNIRRSALMLKESSIAIVASSDVFETEPWGVCDQPLFLNACLRIDTSLSPRELLLRLKSIESEIGRLSSFRWGPREIDMDIIFADELSINEDDLVIPHPEMHRRAFVLVPLKQVAPEWIHPLLGKSVREMEQQISRNGILKITIL